MLKFAAAVAILLTSFFASAVEIANDAYVVRESTQADIAPTRVWTDGTSTFIAFAKPFVGVFPVVYAISDRGFANPTSFVWEASEKRIKVRGVIRHIKLVLGDKSVIIDWQSK